MRSFTTTSAQVKEAIARTGVMALSTTDPDGTPWTSPLGYEAGDDLSVRFLSQMSARHVQNLLREPRVSVAIYSTAGEDGALGLQLAGRAALVSDGGAGWQQFSVTPQEAWCYDSRIDQHRHPVTLD